MQPLVLIRHAESVHHIQNLTGGWTDTALTNKGRQQASLLAHRLQADFSGVDFDLRCSDLLRSIQTAEILGEKLGLPVSIEPGLRDYNNGAAAHKTHEEARAIRTPPEKPYLDWIPYPNAESFRQFFQRITRFMDTYAPQMRSPGLLVTHGSVIQIIVQWWLKMEIETPVSMVIDPASITVLTSNSWQEPTLERLNDSAHLYSPGLSNPLTL